MSYDKALVNKMMVHIKAELDYAEKRMSLMEQVMIPIWQQAKLTGRFRTIIPLLAKDLSDGLAASAWSLLSDAEDPDVMHFKMFIQMADQTPEKNIIDSSKWNLFLTDTEAFLYELPKLTRIAQMMFEKKSTIFKTDQYQLPLNHIEKISKSLIRMKEILALYEASVSEPVPPVENSGMITDPFKEEAEDFLEWCRLNDYEKEFEREKRSIKRKQKRLNTP